MHHLTSSTSYYCKQMSNDSLNPTCLYMCFAVQSRLDTKHHMLSSHLRLTHKAGLKKSFPSDKYHLGASSMEGFSPTAVSNELEYSCHTSSNGTALNGNSSLGISKAGKTARALLCAAFLISATLHFRISLHTESPPQLQGIRTHRTPQRHPEGTRRQRSHAESALLSSPAALCPVRSSG